MDSVNCAYISKCINNNKYKKKVKLSIRVGDWIEIFGGMREHRRWKVWGGSDVAMF